MSTTMSRRVATALAAGCLAGGVAVVVGGGAPAQADLHVPTVGAIAPSAVEKGAGDRASMSSPFIPGVPHVPADVTLAVGPGGAATYDGPDGSVFNGPAGEVDATVQDWWSRQMAAGVTPEEADEQLATGSRTGMQDGDDTETRAGIASMSSPFIPGVPHVPADVNLAIGPDGAATYDGPDASIFNGPADRVNAEVDAWWADQMAAGVTPEQADERLKHLQK